MARNKLLCHGINELMNNSPIKDIRASRVSDTIHQDSSSVWYSYYLTICLWSNLHKKQYVDDYVTKRRYDENI